MLTAELFKFVKPALVHAVLSLFAGSIFFSAMLYALALWAVPFQALISGTVMLSSCVGWLLCGGLAKLRDISIAGQATLAGVLATRQMHARTCPSRPGLLYTCILAAFVLPVWMFSGFVFCCQWLLLAAMTLPLLLLSAMVYALHFLRRCNVYCMCTLIAWAAIACLPVGCDAGPVEVASYASGDAEWSSAAPHEFDAAVATVAAEVVAQVLSGAASGAAAAFSGNVAQKAFAQLWAAKKQQHPQVPVTPQERQGFKAVWGAMGAVTNTSIDQMMHLVEHPVLAWSLEDLKDPLRSTSKSMRTLRTRQWSQFVTIALAILDGPRLEALKAAHGNVSITTSALLLLLLVTVQLHSELACSLCSAQCFSTCACFHLLAGIAT
jgi:hypothetical protein